MDDDEHTIVGPPASRPARQDALVPGTRLGEFELIRVLGEGGFSIVYLAFDHSLQRQVALKEYFPQSFGARAADGQVQSASPRHDATFETGRRSFINEAHLLARFDHPCLVKVYRFWEGNGTAYMAMPYYQGPTLKQTLQALQTPPDEAWLRSKLLPLCDALSVLHAEQCYHRDIAADNVILLANGGQPLLLDFGAARRVVGELAQELTVILKVGYAPIEQYAQVPGLSQGAWTDVYALAALLHFAITGHTPQAAVDRLLEDKTIALEAAYAGRYSARLLRAIDKALIVKPAQRTQSIAAFLDDIGPAPTDPAAARPLPSDSADPPTLLLEAPKRPRRPWLIVPVIALLAAAIAWLGLWNRVPEPPIVADAAAPIASTAVAPPPEPAASAAPPVVPAETISIEAGFDRLVQTQSPGFNVEARPVKPSLRIGRDPLAFRVTATREGYVHVLLLDADGSLILLFPNRRSGVNRIRPGQTLVLPQASWRLTAAAPAGTERFLVLVSSRPRRFATSGVGGEGWFEHFAADASGASIAGEPVCDSGATACDETFGAARFDIDVQP